MGVDEVPPRRSCGDKCCTNSSHMGYLEVPVAGTTLVPNSAREGTENCESPYKSWEEKVHQSVGAGGESPYQSWPERPPRTDSFGGGSPYETLPEKVPKTGGGGDQAPYKIQSSEVP